jgi:hypothetical protein
MVVVVEKRGYPNSPTNITTMKTIKRLMNLMDFGSVVNACGVAIVMVFTAVVFFVMDLLAWIIFVVGELRHGCSRGLETTLARSAT